MKTPFAVALLVSLASTASHAAAVSSSSAPPFHAAAPFDGRAASALFAPYTGAAAPSGSLLSTFVSVVGGLPDIGAAPASAGAPASLFPPVALAATEAGSFSGGVPVASWYSLIGIGGPAPASSLDGTPLGAADAPQAYALLLAGLLAIGFILSRRFD